MTLNHAKTDVIRHIAQRVRGAVPIVVFATCCCTMLVFGIWVSLNEHSADFPAYYVAGKAINQGINIYTIDNKDWIALAQQANRSWKVFPYLYPPLTAGIVSLFADVHYRPALLFWTLLSITSVILSGCALSQVTRRRWIDPFVFAALTCYLPIYTTIYAGQANNFVLLGTSFYLLLLKRRSVFFAFLSMCIGIVVKPTSAPLLVHPLWRRDIPKIIAEISGLCAALCLGIILSGPKLTVYYFQHVVTISGMSVVNRVNTYPTNQSLFGLFGRMAPPGAHIAILSNPLSLGGVLAIVVSIVLALIVAVLAWPRKGHAHSDTYALETGLILVAANLMAPTGWFHHAVISAVPLVLAWHLTDRRLERIALVGALLLLAAQGLFWRQLCALSPVFLSSLGTYGLLVIYSVTALCLFRVKGIHHAGA